MLWKVRADSVLICWTTSRLNNTFESDQVGWPAKRKDIIFFPFWSNIILDSIVENIHEYADNQEGLCSSILNWRHIFPFWSNIILDSIVENIHEYADNQEGLCSSILNWRHFA